MPQRGTNKTRWFILAAGLLLGLAGAVSAQDRDELRQRFEQRFPQLRQLMDAGKVGEMSTGYVGLVRESYGSQKVDPEDDASPTIQQFIDAENNDRRKLYAMVAEEVREDPQTIARRNAVRAFENAKPEWFLKPRDRDWVRKKNLDTDDDDD